MKKPSILLVASTLIFSLSGAATPISNTEKATNQSTEQFLSSLQDVCENCTVVAKFIAEAEKAKCNKEISIESVRNTVQNSAVFAYLLALKATDQGSYEKAISVATKTIDCNDTEWAKKIDSQIKRG